MTRLLHPPISVEVTLDATDMPSYISGVLTGRLQPAAHWLADTDWWERPVSREYWKVLLGGQLLCEVFRDRLEGGWFLERVYD